MKSLTNHYSAVIVFGALFVVSLGGYWYLFNQIRTQTVNTQLALGKITTEENKALSQKIFLDVLQKTADQRKNLITYFVPYDRTISFIDSLQAISTITKAKITLQSIGTDNLNDVEVGTTGVLTVHISAVGTWAQVIRTLHIIENMPYEILIDNVRAGSDDAGKWTIDFDTKTLIIK